MRATKTIRWCRRWPGSGYDHEAPALLTERHLQQLTAPHQEPIWFERSAHFIDTEVADKFNRFFVERLVQGTRAIVEALEE